MYVGIHDPFQRSRLWASERSIRNSFAKASLIQGRSGRELSSSIPTLKFLYLVIEGG